MFLSAGYVELSYLSSMFSWDVEGQKNAASSLTMRTSCAVYKVIDLDFFFNLLEN
jgi:hypothetical protein